MSVAQISQMQLATRGAMARGTLTSWSAPNCRASAGGATTATLARRTTAANSIVAGCELEIGAEGAFCFSVAAQHGIVAQHPRTHSIATQCPPCFTATGRAIDPGRAAKSRLKINVSMSVVLAAMTESIWQKCGHL
jgi:hypothetical protein